MTINGILAKKIGMTRLFLENGKVTSVTILEAGPCIVTQVKTRVKDGYQAVQLGFEEHKRINKPEGGHLKKAEAHLRHLREVSVDELGDIQVGQKVDVTIFQPGEQVDVIGASKGRGFAGVVKRHNFSGGPKTHGQSDRHRAPGSIGSGTFPGRVVKGMRMAGHMGNQRVTALNLQIARVDPERNLLLIEGGIPGAPDGLVIVRRAVKGKGKA
ncbi:MAG: 50S ribosomal protein L3 [Dehalococcoidia bacterium]|nr:50S ribosomal protein L3 [Dehalococcoidia bacterium]